MRLEAVFARAYRVSDWSDRRFTLAGKTVLSVTVTAGVFGIDTSRTMAFQVFALGAGLLLVAWISSLRWRPRLDMVRRLPAVASLGSPVRYEILIDGPDVDRLPGVLVRDELQVRFPARRKYHRQDGADAARNYFDRHVGYQRWLGALTALRGASLPPLVIPVLSTRPVRLVQEFVPLRRGVLRFDRIRLLKPDVLGLVNAGWQEPLPQTLIVLPQQHPVATPAFAGARRRQQGGFAMLPRTGDSQEFLQIRDYRPGDPLRRIHWGRSAHAGRLVVKEMGDEYVTRYGLILDTFAEGVAEAAFEAAVSTAASLVASVALEDALVDLMFVENRAVTATGGRGHGGALVLLEELAEVVPARIASFDVLAKAVIAHAPGLGACVHVLLALDDARLELVRALGRRGMEQRVFLVSDLAPPRRVADVPFHHLRPSHLAQDLREV
ncbi:MAG: DUF58 domain-containing protein [Betaproteobacteria bacterium]|nr:DUF58 domain-containing protein [Betaproteobacteria bacterium]